MIIRRMALAALVGAIVPIGGLARAQAQSTTLTLDNAPYAPIFGFDRYVEGDFSITQAPFQSSPRLSGGTLISTGQSGLYYINGNQTIQPPSFTLSRTDGLGFTYKGFSLTSFSADPFLPTSSTYVTVTPVYAFESDTVLTSLIFTFDVPNRQGFLLDSITVGSQALATPGPIVGAGLPALLALTGGWFLRRRHGSAA